MVGEQYFMLLLDTEASLGAIPDLLPRDLDARRKAMGAIRTVLGARGEITGEVETRLHHIAKLFDVDAKPLAPPAGNTRRIEQTKVA